MAYPGRVRSLSIINKPTYVNNVKGKTTLMSTVIESLLNDKVASNGQCFVGYFYFKHQQNDTHNVMLRAILEQLLRQNSALLVQIFDEVAMLEGVNLRTTTKLENLVKTAFESYKSLYIILDGLDECAKGETKKTVDWYLSLLDTKAKNSTSALRIIFSGQRDGVLDKRLSQQLSISLETSAHSEDIYRYCQGVCKEITAKFFKSSSSGEKAQNIEQQILSLVTSEAKGQQLFPSASMIGCSSTNVRHVSLCTSGLGESPCSDSALPPGAGDSTRNISPGN